MEFPKDKFKPERDRYAKARGGSSQFLYIACSSCEEPAMVYQKDGPGRLLRMYADRIVWPPQLVERQQAIRPDTIKKAGALACSNCEEMLGLPMIYASENRPAYRVIPGALRVHKNIPQ